jgi:uncharacterized protein
VFMKINRKSFIYVFLLLCILLITAGIIFNPSFVAKHVKGASELSPKSTVKVIHYQLYAVTAGFMILVILPFYYKRKVWKYSILPVFIIYLLLVHAVYVNRMYPDNVFLNISGLKKTWNVLLGEEFVLRDYQPKSSLIVENKKLLKAKFPVIDVHFHLRSLKNISADELVRAMDACGIREIVNLDGRPGDFEKYNKDFKGKYPDRFIMFAQLKLWEYNKPDFLKYQLNTLDNMITMGAQGLKVTKNLGLGIKDRTGNLVPIDDPRLDPIWARAGESKIPVLMHLTDPTPFFYPVNRLNERYEELREFPDWSYYGPEFPKKETLLLQREHLLGKHPKTIFIFPHMADNPENLAYLGYLLDKYSNLYLDISSRLPELGRQPFTARKFFIKYQDRILFGSDGGYGLDPNGSWSVQRYYRTYIEFLETRNEYFEYPLFGIQKQGRWYIYGIDLPDSVLEKIYYKNAENIFSKKRKEFSK